MSVTAFLPKRSTAIVAASQTKELAVTWDHPSTIASSSYATWELNTFPFLKTLKRPAMAHQIDALKFLSDREERFGAALLGDDMGLGKTTSVILLILARAMPALSSSSSSLTGEYFCLLGDMMMD